MNSNGLWRCWRKCSLRLRQEYTAAGKVELFAHLKGCLTGEKNTETYTAIAQRLNMTEGALKMTMQRMRHRYRELLREEIAQTGTNPDEVEPELRALQAALS